MILHLDPAKELQIHTGLTHGSNTLIIYLELFGLIQKLCAAKPKPESGFKRKQVIMTEGIQFHQISFGSFISLPCKLC